MMKVYKPNKLEPTAKGPYRLFKSMWMAQSLWNCDRQVRTMKQFSRESTFAGSFHIKNQRDDCRDYHLSEGGWRTHVEYCIVGTVYGEYCLVYICYSSQWLHHLSSFCVNNHEDKHNKTSVVYVKSSVL
jgi:hypothetical protein